MYYSEKMIDGILHYKTSPNMEWKPMSLKELSSRIEKLNHKLSISDSEIEKAALEDYQKQTKWDKSYDRKEGFVQGVKWVINKKMFKKKYKLIFLDIDGVLKQGDEEK